MERMAIIGAPGSGKTTLLQHVALVFAANKQRQCRLRGYTPLLLFLREHAKTIVEEKPNLASLAQMHFSNVKRYPTLNPPPEWFARQLEGGHCVVLLDGLDEVATIDERRAVAKWVDQQTSIYNRCPFVLTARPGGYKEAQLNQAHVLEVQPFNSEQVQVFIHNWYLATKIALSGKDDTGIQQDASREADDLLRRLRTRPVLQELAINPLLLTMMALVHNHRGVLPGSRVELYNEICDVFLEHWQRAKNMHDPLNAAQKRTALQPLAAYMMEQPHDDDNNRRTISEKKALEVMTPYLQKTGLSDEQITYFLPNVQKSSLLLEAEAGQWSFAHLTFQEYLCAAHWQQDGAPPTDWQPLVQDSWWHETLRLYAAQADATALVQVCLSLDTLNSLTLATELNEESLQMDTSVRQILRIRFKENLNAQDANLRRLAAEVHLNHRLKNAFSPLDEQHSIGTHFVTCAEYQLFLDDMRVQGKYHQPDHWTTFTFPTGQAKMPITGVCFEDAQAFCQWLNTKTGHQYRLPTEEEIEPFWLKNESSNLFTWGREGRLLGLNSFYEKKVQIQLKEKIPSSLPLSKTIVQSLNWIRKQDSDLAQSLDQDLAIGLAFAQDQNFVFAKNFDENKVFVRNFVQDFNPNFDLAQNIIQNLTQHLVKVENIARKLNQSLIQNLDQSKKLAEKLVEDIDRRLKQEKDDERDNDRERARFFGIDQQLDERVRNLPQDLERIQNLAQNRAKKLDFDIVLSFDINPVFDADFTLPLEIERAIDIKSQSKFVKFLMLFYYKQRAQILNRARSLAQVLSQGRVLDQSLTPVPNPAFPKAFDDIRILFEKNEFDKVRDKIHLMLTQQRLSDRVRRRIVLMEDVLKIAQSNTFLEWRQAKRYFAIHTLEYTYLGSKMREQVDSHTWQKRWQWWKRSTDVAVRQQRYLELYWTYQLIELREKGEMPAWEGIRLVRER